MRNFQLLSFILLVLLSGCHMKQEETIDHIILGINDLDKGIAQFKELTGVEPVFGGIHPNSFSQNALVALDGETYIEIMAPKPDAQNIPAHFLILEKLTPIGFAVRTRNAIQSKEKLKAAGLITTTSKDGSRAKPDGTLLSWTTFGVEPLEYPFFIEWGDGTVHPSTTSPKGCSMQSFDISTPDDAAMKQLNITLKLGLNVSNGPNMKLQLTINTPKGQVTIP